MKKKRNLEADVNNLAKVIDEIIQKLPHKFNGFEFPYEKVKLSLDDFLQLTLMRSSTTLQFGKEMNEQRREYWPNGETKLIDLLRAAFWWPAVDDRWVLQSFQARVDEKGPSDRGLYEVYYLVRIGSIEIQTATDPQVANDIYWLGVKSKKSYQDE